MNKYEIKDELNQKRTRTRRVEGFNKDRQVINEGSHQHDYFSKEAKLKAREIKDCLESHPDYTLATFEEKIRHVLIALFPLCAYLINILLLSQSAEYLISLNVQIPFLAPILVIFVPVLFVMLILIVATTIAAMKDDDSKTIELCNRLIVWITPTLFVSTNVARYRPEDYNLANILLLLSLFLLAAITDSILLKGAKQIRTSWGYIYYFVSYHNLDTDCRRLELESERAFHLVGETFDNYIKALKEFNDEHPKAQIVFPPFNETSDRVIRKWLARKYTATN